LSDRIKINVCDTLYTRNRIIIPYVHRELGRAVWFLQDNGPPGCFLLFLSVYHYRAPKVSPAVEGSRDGIGQDKNIRLECLERRRLSRVEKLQRHREARFKNRRDSL